MSEILDSIYIWVFLVKIESVLLLALLKYMLCSQFTQNCIFLYFLVAKNPYFVTKNCWKFSYICVFVLSKKRLNWFHKNLHNSGMDGRTKLLDTSLSRIFNALSIGVQYTLSFKNIDWEKESLYCIAVKLLITLKIEHVLPAISSQFNFFFCFTNCTKFGHLFYWSRSIKKISSCVKNKLYSNYNL